MTDGPFTRVGDRVRFAVRVTPKASRDALGGPIVTPDGRNAVAVRLAAAPVDGAANKALIGLLAKTLSVPKSRVRIVSGESSRLKIVEVDGASAEALEALKS
ncbi:MAG TPA: DUF167 domain-containing protein [Allosphingosinicella sp.]|nr:DUF167 domain-containing protein [Allosphingosinicella sp.]